MVDDLSSSFLKTRLCRSSPTSPTNNRHKNGARCLDQDPDSNREDKRVLGFFSLYRGTMIMLISKQKIPFLVAAQVKNNHATGGQNHPFFPRTDQNQDSG